VPKHDIKVKLTGYDGNGMAVIGRVRKELRANGVPDEEITRFTEEALFGDYSHLLTTCMKYVEVS